MHQESKDKKEKWFRPKLTVLTKGGSPENVLAGCKSGSRFGPVDRGCAWYAQHNMCAMTPPFLITC
jgi:hypothetical protein